MATADTGLYKTGDTVRRYFMWLDSDNLPLTSLSPAPTLERIAPDGTQTTGIALTQLGATELWFYDLTGTTGIWTLTGVCTDSDVAEQRTDPVTVEFSTYSLTDLPLSSELADVDDLSAGVWDRGTSLLTTAGSIGKAIVDFMAYATTKLGLIFGSRIRVTPHYDARTNTVTMYRGDTKPIIFDGLDSGLTGATAITFSARLAEASGDPDAQLTNGTAPSDTSLRFVPTEAFYELLPDGQDYVCDIQVTLASGGGIFSPLQKSKLVIIDDVTR